MQAQLARLVDEMGFSWSDIAFLLLHRAKDSVCAYTTIEKCDKAKAYIQGLLDHDKRTYPLCYDQDPFGMFLGFAKICLLLNVCMCAYLIARVRVCGVCMTETEIIDGIEMRVYRVVDIQYQQLYPFIYQRLSEIPHFSNYYFTTQYKYSHEMGGVYQYIIARQREYVHARSNTPLYEHVKSKNASQKCKLWFIIAK
jgi:hypothetical protein